MKQPRVAPRTGAWIEIPADIVKLVSATVAPRTGAWIEMFSLQSVLIVSPAVAPRTGAWIEILVFSSR